ncbi:MAG: hypothetical protein LBE55_03900 [Clostridiales bacterium]|nr:hypothetical protein [Clostridiales bacterium]
MKWNRSKALGIASIGIGLISGLLRPQFLAEYAHAELVASLQHFAEGFYAQNMGISAFFAAAFRYGRTLLLIWACAVLPKAHYAALLVLYMRAMALGFSAAMMVTALGGRGFGAAMALYGLQNLIIMPIYAYTVYFIGQNRLALAFRPPENPLLVAKVAAMGLAAVAVVSIIEIYISPILFIMIWR